MILPNTTLANVNVLPRRIYQFSLTWDYGTQLHSYTVVSYMNALTSEVVKTTRYLQLITATS